MRANTEIEQLNFIGCYAIVAKKISPDFVKIKYIKRINTNFKINVMTKEEQEEYDQSVLDWQKECEEAYKKDDSIIDAVKSLISKGFFNELEEYLKETETNYRYAITETAPKEEFLQGEDGDFLKESWVDQYRNGGYTGDDHAGQVWIKISEKEWFTYHYEC